MSIRLYTLTQLPAGTISVMARPRGGDWLMDEIQSLHTAGVAMLVSLLTNPEIYELDLVEEAACCAERNITYCSFPIPDFSVPSFTTPTFQFLKQLHACLVEEKHVAIHCRQGLGRSVTIAACLLVLSDISAEQACTMLSQTRGYTVPETSEQRQWVSEFERAYKRGELENDV